MMAVCPTLGTAAVGVTQAGRRDGGRRLAGFRFSSKSRCFFAMPQRRHSVTTALPTWLEAFVSLFRFLG